MLLQFHIKQRVGAGLFVEWGSIVGFEAEVGIEGYGGFILFVDGQFVYTVFIYSVFEQFFAYALMY